MIKIGFDIGGVLTKYPEVFKPVLVALEASPDVEVHILTDVLPPRSLALVRNNGYDIPEDRIHSARPDEGDDRKARMVERLGLNVMIDDHLPYLAGIKCLRLHVMPDPSRPFFDPSIKPYYEVK